MEKIESLQIVESFKRHLTEDNKRIIFSGAFGTGKTFFLNEFFENNTEYEYFRLAPVNYVISSNKDIIELIKFNIVFKIIEKNLIIDNEKLKTSFLQNLKFYIENKPYDFIFKIIDCIPELGEKVSKVAKNLLEIKNSIDTLKSNTEKNELELLVDYLKSFEEKKGIYLENDFITSIIQETVDSINKNKKSVLIIDDLDRIDPEHIFRILNIFSAYLDINGNENKFNFSHVIIVCDIQNIRNIYQAKYGINVDFNGYIDKFSSKKVYEFNFKNELNGIIEFFLKSIDYNQKYISVFDIKTENSNLKFILKIMIKLLIDSNQINVRHLKKLYSSYYQIRNYRIVLVPEYTQNWHYSGVLMLDFLEFLLGGADSLTKVLDNCTKTNTEQYVNTDNFKILDAGLPLIIPILGFNKTKEKDENSGILTFEIEDIEFEITPIKNERNKYFCRVETQPTVYGNNIVLKNMKFMPYLQKAYEILKINRSKDSFND